MQEGQILYERQDWLSELNRKLPLNTKLQIIHNAVQTRFPGVDRIAVALYEEKSGMLKTFIASSGKDQPLVRYEIIIGRSPFSQRVGTERKGTGCP